MSIKLIKPTWPAPDNIVAFTTTRQGGFSEGKYASLNLGTHVEDNSLTVTRNRDLLQNTLTLPNHPAWLTQTHSTIAIYLDKNFTPCEADASYTDQKNQLCSVMTADCLPLLICNKQGNEIAAIHAGWQGLGKGVIEATIAKLNSKPQNLLAWLGPAIGPHVFEVGADVYDLFTRYDPNAESGFTVITTNKWLMNIYHIAKQRLADCGITHVYGGNYCTYSDPENFFSYRRDRITGRMASIIYIQ